MSIDRMVRLRLIRVEYSRKDPMMAQMKKAQGRTTVIPAKNPQMPAMTTMIFKLL